MKPTIKQEIISIAKEFYTPEEPLTIQRLEALDRRMQIIEECLVEILASQHQTNH